jgi:CRP/FNR family cyclic AMP-dependent transcriptional regulator
LTLKDPAERIRLLFFMLSFHYGKKTTDGTLLDTKLSHQNIADMTGLTRETVTRILNKWENSEEITMLGNKLIRLGPKFMKEL